MSVYSGASGSYREDPAGPTAGLAEPVPCDDMPAVSGAAGGRGLVKRRGAGGAQPRCLLSFFLLRWKERQATNGKHQPSCVIFSHASYFFFNDFQTGKTSTMCHHRPDFTSVSFQPHRNTKPDKEVGPHITCNKQTGCLGCNSRSGVLLRSTHP